jgi:enamine deaminase RidA (YjgF/YER057c/UK114 family)
MIRRLISSGSRFEKIASYSRAVVDGEWVFVSGTTGFDYAKMSISPDDAEQTRQIFRNIAAALAEADASLADVVMVRYYLSAAEQFAHLAPIFGQHFADARPAATAVVVGFVDPAMKIEIEVVARRRP